MSLQVQLDPRTRMLVIRAYDEAQPPAGPAYQDWVQETAERFNLSHRQVVSVVANHVASFEAAIKSEYRTKAQQIADRLGMTLDRTLEAVRDGMYAEKAEVLYESFPAGEGNGSIKRPIMDENGKIKPFVQPDNMARSRFVDMGLKIHGAYAPEEQNINIQHNVQLEELTTEQLQQRRQEILSRVQSVTIDAEFTDVTPRPAAAIAAPVSAGAADSAQTPAGHRGVGGNRAGGKGKKGDR